MIGTGIVIWILFIHWIADFVFQSDKMAKNKSKNIYWLLNHTVTYSVIFMFMITFVWVGSPSAIDAVVKSILFAAITFGCHSIVDYITSRINSSLWAKNNIHMFFVSIGFDQFIHFVQLILTYYLINNY